MRCGAVLGIAFALSQLRYGRCVGHEIEQVRKAAHLRNWRLGLPCSCGTIRACESLPEPHETGLGWLLGEHEGEE